LVCGGTAQSLHAKSAQQGANWCKFPTCRCSQLQLEGGKSLPNFPLEFHDFMISWFHDFMISWFHDAPMRQPTWTNLWKLQTGSLAER
jgi:hypothetical protein